MNTIVYSGGPDWCEVCKREFTYDHSVVTNTMVGCVKTLTGLRCEDEEQCLRHRRLDVEAAENRLREAIQVYADASPEETT